jgi:hypothetical protein
MTTLCTLWGSKFDTNEVASINWYCLYNGYIKVAVKNYANNDLASCKIK